MNQLNYLLNSPVIPWVILLLSASSLTVTLTLLVKALTSLKSSILTKSQKQNLISFLPMLSDFLITTLPNLSEALKTVLLNHGLLNLPNQEQTSLNQELQQTPESLTMEQIEKISNFIKETFNS